jgi:L-alanine-DL-glutamate epimerase-like enolase superfamily enzyme
MSIRDGKLMINPGLGLGVEVDEEKIEKYAI